MPKPDKTSLDLIKKALDMGYSPLDLGIAIAGNLSSKFHQGENSDHKVYDSLSLILRNNEKIDQFINQAVVGHVDRAVVAQRMGIEEGVGPVSDTEKTAYNARLAKYLAKHVVDDSKLAAAVQRVLDAPDYNHDMLDLKVIRHNVRAFVEAEVGIYTADHHTTLDHILQQI